MRTAFFDLDGTLVDSRLGITRSMAYALEALGVEPPSADVLATFIGADLRDVFRSFVPEERVEPAVTAYRARYQTGMFEASVYRGVPEMLKALRSDGIATHVVTSKPRVFAEKIVANFGLAIDHVFGTELDGTNGDKRVLLRLAMRHTSATAGMMVGDRRFDLEAAHANGLDAIGVGWGYGTHEELASASAICATPAHVVQHARR